MKRIRLSIGGYIRADNGVRGQIVSGHRQARLLVGVGLSPGATSRSLEISLPDFHGNERQAIFGSMSGFVGLKRAASSNAASHGVNIRPALRRDAAAEPASPEP